MKSIIALSVLLVSQAAAKIGFGACPKINFLSRAMYESVVDPAGNSVAAYNHKVVWGDKGLQDLLGFAKTFVP
jgi:hypothetical protein